MSEDDNNNILEESFPEITDFPRKKKTNVSGRKREKAKKQKWEKVFLEFTIIVVNLIYS